jgi:tryptophan synthase alpha chain
MGRDRITELFDRARAEGRAVFLPFLTAGLPDPGSSPSLFRAMAEAGADGFEVGIPYSDPLMDGPVIQRGSELALAAGTRLEVAFDIVGRVTRLGKPVLAMTYSNPVFRRGPAWFCGRLRDVGADGLIVADLPVEEAQPLLDAAAEFDLGVVLFVAPTSTDERIRRVVEADPVFVYAVAELGVTGERDDPGGHIARLVERVKAAGDVPVVAGVGIAGPEQARRAAEAGADGVIIGSAIVRRVLEAGSVAEAEEALRDLVARVADSLRVRADTALPE